MLRQKTNKKGAASGSTNTVFTTGVCGLPYVRCILVVCAGPWLALGWPSKKCGRDCTKDQPALLLQAGLQFSNLPVLSPAGCKAAARKTTQSGLTHSAPRSPHVDVARQKQRRRRAVVCICASYRAECSSHGIWSKHTCKLSGTRSAERSKGLRVPCLRCEW